MPLTTRPTIKQKAAFSQMLEAIKTGKDVELKKIMIKAGFSELTARNPETNLLSKESFQQLLNQIDDSEILNKFREILKAEDKRASIAAGVELLKLKDRYPAQKSKIIGLFESLSNLEGSE